MESSGARLSAWDLHLLIDEPLQVGFRGVVVVLGRQLVELVDRAEVHDVDDHDAVDEGQHE